MNGIVPLSQDDLGTRIVEAFAGRHVAAHVSLDELSLEVEPASYIDLLRYLRDDPACLFVCFLDLCGVDYPSRPHRFDVVVHLLSPKHNRRVRVKVRTDEETPLRSAVSVFPAANWYEREAYDLFGILFTGHPDLRRILTDYGFEGHPLRKDFPMTGYVEVWWNDLEKRVATRPVNLTQEFRNWDFLSPWEGMDSAALPGDEKAKAP